MKKAILILILLSSIIVNAQVTFILETIPPYTPPEDNIYIAGSFNAWDPGDENFQLYENSDGLWEITLAEAPIGSTIEYKFTRGDWTKVEKGPNGEEIPNREFTYGNGDTVFITIHNWADNSPGGSTAAENVHILDEDFYIPQLDRTRRIWIYLPPDYESSGSDYPVIYMHDGQNLFDNSTSFAGEWEVDETLNELFSGGYKVPIVVGIDHGGVHRIDELTPWNNPSYGGGDGDKYLAFIIETLKPYVDENYNTLTGRAHTAVMGSSLGGLISTYGALKYQSSFSKAGSFSPAYWINNDSIWEFVSSIQYIQDIMFYQNIGSQEGNSNISNMFMMEDSLIMLGFTNVYSKLIAGAGHNEQTWKEDFESAYLWLFGDYANINENDASGEQIWVYPNPAENFISIKGLASSDNAGITIMDSSGKLVYGFPEEKDRSSIDISDFPAGSYYVIINKDNTSVTIRFIKK